MDKKVKKPFVFLCTGMSLDGKLSNYKGQQIEIATNDDKSMRYEFRAKADAIMVGGHTLLQDDPKLILRAKVKKKEDPIKIGVISNANNLNLRGDFFSTGKAKKIIFTTKQTSVKKVEKIKRKASVYVLGRRRVNLKRALETLFDLGVKKLMVEGGGTLIYSLLKNGLIDEINLKIGNIIVGGKNSVTLVEGKGFGKLNFKKVKFLKLIKKPNYLILKARP